MLRKTTAVHGQSISMQSRLVLYWVSMALAVFAALMLILSFMGVFSSSAKKLHELLNLQQQHVVVSVENHMDVLNARCMELSRGITTELMDILTVKGKQLEDLNDNTELILEVEKRIVPQLHTALQASGCSGVFFLLDATCNTKGPGAKRSRMGVYLRYSDLSSVNTVNEPVVCFRGMEEAAENVPGNSRWNLEFDTEEIPEYDRIMQASVTKLEDHCRWTGRMEQKDTRENVTLLCVPILDDSGQVCGICGAEISERYFRLLYPAADSPYGSIGVALAEMNEQGISLDHAMPGAWGDASWKTDGILTVKKEKYYNVYSGDRGKYLGMHQLLPAYTTDGKQLSVVTFLSGVNYENMVLREQKIWIAGSLVFLLLMILTSCLLSRHFVTPVTQIVESVREEIPPEGHSCGIREIDELIDCFRRRAQTQSEQELPPNIEELLASFVERVNTLTPMERTVLQYYIEGCNIEEIAVRSFISVNTVKKHNTNINRKLSVTSREELLLYIDLFRRCGRLEEIAYYEPRDKWT